VVKTTNYKNPFNVILFFVLTKYFLTLTESRYIILLFAASPDLPSLYTAERRTATLDDQQQHVLLSITIDLTVYKGSPPLYALYYLAATVEQSVRLATQFRLVR
jgi:hypothetical protein